MVIFFPTNLGAYKLRLSSYCNKHAQWNFTSRNNAWQDHIQHTNFSMCSEWKVGCRHAIIWGNEGNNFYLKYNFNSFVVDKSGPSKFQPLIL